MATHSSILAWKIPQTEECCSPWGREESGTTEWVKHTHTRTHTHAHTHTMYRVSLFQATSPLDYKEIKPVHPEGHPSWLFIGRTDAEAETPILWPPDVKNWLMWEDPDAGKDWRQEEKGTLFCWWEWKLVQPLWRAVWRFLKKLQIELPYDPAIRLLGIHTKETRS